MSKRVLGLALAAWLACGLAFTAAPAMAADYYQPPPPQPIYAPPPPPSCCCPTVRRGFYFNFSSCGYRGGYTQYQQPYPGYGGYPQDQYQQSYQAPAYQAPAYYAPQPYQAYPQQGYYQPGYAPQVGVGVGVGPVGVGIGAGVAAGSSVAYRGSRQNCWRNGAGRWICR
jgi:hypothetical protein